MGSARRPARARTTGVELAVVLLLAACTASPPPGGAGTGSGVVASPAATPTSAAPTTESPEPTYLSTVTVDPLLPSADPLPAGLLATTDAGWLIATVTAWSTKEYSDDTRSADATYLVSPDGTRYELPDLGGVVLDQWLPGTSLALGLVLSEPEVAVEIVDLETGRAAATVDLDGLRRASGSDRPIIDVTFVGDGSTDLVLTASGPPSTTSVVERTSLQGEVLARADTAWYQPLPSPDGRHLLGQVAGQGPVVIDPESLSVVATPEPPPGGECLARHWLDASRWLETCSGDASSTWLVEGLGTESWRIPVDPQAWVQALVGTAGGSVLIGVTPPGTSSAHAFRASPDTLDPIDAPLTAMLLARGTTVIGTDNEVTDGESSSWWPTPMVAWDTTSDTTTTLVPVPADGGATSHVTPVAIPGELRSIGLLVDPDGHLGTVGD